MRDLNDLLHQSKPLSGGGEVLVLDTGAMIDSEAQAMLAALHSRSPGGIRHHLQVLGEKGAEKFMSTFYVGYGHKSIGDNGTACVFVEGVSMLAAKALQDFPLYNGQEVSTRYVDFSKQKFIDPVGTPISDQILENLRAFYLHGLDVMIPVLTERFPRSGDESEAVYSKAIKARAFDTMRAFLPAGASTNLAWFGELRQFMDRIPVLRHHPLEEVREIANAIEDTLLLAFPSSFPAKEKQLEEKYQPTEAYHERTQAAYAYFNDPNPVDFELSRNDIRPELLEEYRMALETRPPKTELPFALRECGLALFRFLLDFGSFRDLQRHRAVTIPMPLLTMDHGFEPWYLEELPEELRKEAEHLLADQRLAVERLGLSPEVAQYYIPMGYRCTIRMTGDLRSLVYLVELRATPMVHRTLRVRAKTTADALLMEFAPAGLVLHLDPNFDRFDVRRGEQDIVRVD